MAHQDKHRHGRAGLQSTLDAIAEATTCQRPGCTRPLDHSPSTEFCGEYCQATWHAERVGTTPDEELLITEEWGLWTHWQLERYRDAFTNHAAAAQGVTRHLELTTAPPDDDPPAAAASAWGGEVTHTVAVEWRAPNTVHVYDISAHLSSLGWTSIGWAEP